MSGVIVCFTNTLVHLYRHICVQQNCPSHTESDKIYQNCCPAFGACRHQLKAQLNVSVFNKKIQSQIRIPSTYYSKHCTIKIFPQIFTLVGRDIFASIPNFCCLTLLAQISSPGTLQISCFSASQNSEQKSQMKIVSRKVR